MDFEAQQYLKHEEEKLKLQHEEYLRSHPQLHRLMADFVNECLLHRPEDVYLFARQYFVPFSNTELRFQPVVLVCTDDEVRRGLLLMLATEYPDDIAFIPSHTTRPPRKGEINGLRYNFVSKDEFQKMVHEGRFLEHVMHRGEAYGKASGAMEEAIRLGKLPILDVDMQGAQTINQSAVACRYVAVTPTSVEEYEKQLKDCGTDAALVKTRLEEAKRDLQFVHQRLFEHVISSNELSEAGYALRSILTPDILKRRARFSFQSTP